MKDYYWICPKCGEKVSLSEVFDTLFDDNGEAVFMPEFGVPFYMLYCTGCNMAWDVSISKMFDGNDTEEINIDIE